MCLNSEQDFTASPHEIFHETSLGPDALFITTKKFLFNYKVVFQYIYVKHILLNYSYPGSSDVHSIVRKKAQDLILF